MVETGKRILISVLIVVIVVSNAFANGSQKIVSCEEAAKNASMIKVGMKESEVLDLLGSPKIITESMWSYSFDCVKLPPKVGETVITGLDIFFSDGTVKEIKRGWVDVTGMRRPTKRRNQRKGRPAP
jgi:hypothetical protein